MVCVSLQREHESVLHSVKTDHCSQLSGLKKQVYTLEQEVEKYRILAGIERPTHDDEWDDDGLPCPQSTSVTVATQCKQVPTSVDVITERTRVYVAFT